MKIVRAKSTPWELDSPDELAALERLDPNLRGLAHNPVFRYLRYLSRSRKQSANREYILPFSLGAVGMIAALVYARLRGPTSSPDYVYAILQSISMGLIGSGIRQAEGPPPLFLIRNRSMTWNLGIVSAVDLGPALWAHITRRERVSSRIYSLFFASVAVLLAFGVRGFWGAFLSSTLAGCAALMLGSNRGLHWWALTRARKQVRESITLERRTAADFGYAQDRSANDGNIEKNFDALTNAVACMPLNIITALFMAFIAFITLDLSASSPWRVNIGFGINLALSALIAGLGWLTGLAAYRMSPKEIERNTLELRRESEELIRLWSLRAQALGATSEEALVYTPTLLGGVNKRMMRKLRAWMKA